MSVGVKNYLTATFDVDSDGVAKETTVVVHGLVGERRTVRLAAAVADLAVDESAEKPNE